MDVVRIPLAPLAGLVAFLATALAQRMVEKRLRPGLALAIGLSVGLAMSIAEKLRRPMQTAWLRSRRPSGGATGDAPLAQAVGEGPVSAPPRVEGELRRVVASGETQLCGGVALSILSLESYADGFILNGRLVPGEVQQPHRGEMMHPFVVLTVSDDRGNAYDVHPAGGSGDGHEWRFAYRCGQAIAAEARELRLEVTEVRWRRFDEKRHEFVVTKIEECANTFVVTL